jgi:hypothetical protein
MKMIFPQLSPAYYDEKDNLIKQRMEAFYAESIALNQSFWAEADTDWRFECGDQTVWQDVYGNLPINRRRQFSFNRIRPIKNMISGYQRRNRKSTICVPIENGDDKTADQYTKILMWINQREHVLETISDAFEGAVVCGMNFLHVWLDYRSDCISGDIKIDNLPYNSFLVDPFFRKTDLSDCRGIWKRSFLTKAECISLLPDKADMILPLVGNDQRDAKFQFLPENYNLGFKNLLTYDEFYYRAYRTQRMLVDSKTGECKEWQSNNEEGLTRFLQQFPQITVIEQEIPTVRLAIVVQGRVTYDGPNPLGIDTYPFVPVTTYYNPQIPYYPWRITGVVRGLRDPQYLFNHRKTIEMDVLESQVNSGWIYKESALVNPKDIFMSGQGKGIALKDEAQITDVQKIMPADIPPGMFQLSELLAKEIMTISGVNEELMGQAIDDKAGVLAMLRQGAGLTTLQGLFDNLDKTQKLLGKLMIDIINVNFAPGKVSRILEEDPTPQFYGKAFGKYECAIEEGLNTTTQKQMQLAQMVQLREIGVQIPDISLVEAATFQEKTKIIETMQQAQQQQQQMAEQQSQVAMQEMQARTELSHARATADAGLGLERLSRIQENKALAKERQAAAVKDENLAILDMAKALKEIESADFEHIEKLVTLMHMIKGQENEVMNQERDNETKSAS